MLAVPTAFFQSIVHMIYIRAMNLAALDLNLLVALDALLREASVGRAALQLGLSQPAVSHALRRLRETLGDPLLVRVGARMELTPRAQSLRAPLAEALEQLRGLFVPAGFDPGTSSRRFALMIPDHVINLLAPLMTRVAAEAPGVRLDITPWRGAAAMHPDFARRIDLVINCHPDAFPGFHRQRLFGDRDMLAVRRRHPQTARLNRMDGFLAARFVAVIGRGLQEDPIDTWLLARGIRRQIALSVPSYLQALHTVARSDLAAFVPSRLIASLQEQLALATVVPPVDPGPDEEFLFWPSRNHTDPASAWLRKLVLEVGRKLDRPARRAA